MTTQVRHKATPWPVLRNALTTFLDVERAHVVNAAGELDVTETMKSIRRAQRELRVAVSLHAFLLYCAVRAAAAHPNVNTYRHKAKLIEFEDIDVLTPIDKRLPSGVRIPVGHIVRAAQGKSLAQINWELRQAVRSADLEGDVAVQKRRRIARLPRWARRWISWRVRSDPFLLKRLHGTLALTSVHTQGFSKPFFPITATAHTMTIAIGSMIERPRLNSDGSVEVRRILCLSGAGDHEVIDGMQLAAFVHHFAELVESGAGLNDEFLLESRVLLGTNKSVHAAHT